MEWAFPLFWSFQLVFQAFPTAGMATEEQKWAAKPKKRKKGCGLGFLCVLAVKSQKLMPLVCTSLHFLFKIYKIVIPKAVLVYLLIAGRHTKEGMLVKKSCL